MLEYFISTHGARKGLADTALRTADSGYLTRRLVDVAQDVIIRERDCGTKEFIELTLLSDDGRPERQPGRPRRGRGVSRPSAGASLVEKGAEIDRAELADDLRGLRGRTAWRRRCARCSSARPSPGVCQACYGRSLASGKTAQIGDAVGIIAAQSIGEPGTQLTMRTFHTGGVAGADITHGLPRVVELFEARKPKGLAQIAEHRRHRPRRGDRQGPHRRHHRRRGRGAPPHVPAPHAPVRDRGREGRGRAAAQRGLAVPARAAQAPRPDGDRAATSSRRCRRSTSPRAWTSTTSTSS